MVYGLGRQLYDARVLEVGFVFREARQIRLCRKRIDSFDLEQL